MVARDRGRLDSRDKVPAAVLEFRRRDSLVQDIHLDSIRRRDDRFLGSRRQDGLHRDDCHRGIRRQENRSQDSDRQTALPIRYTERYMGDREISTPHTDEPVAPIHRRDDNYPRIVQTESCCEGVCIRW